MKKKLVFIVCASTLAMLAGSAAATAGEFQFGFSFGYSSHPGYGYYGYYPPPRAYVYRPYVPRYAYAVPVVWPYSYVPRAYVPYRYRVVASYGPYYAARPHGKAYGHYRPRRYGRYY